MPAIRTGPYGFGGDMTTTTPPDTWGEFAKLVISCLTATPASMDAGPSWGGQGGQRPVGRAMAVVKGKGW